MKDPILDLLISTYSGEMLLPRNLRAEPIKLWQEKRQIQIRDEEHDLEAQAEDESINHILSFVAWYENRDGSINYDDLDEDEYCDMDEFCENGGAFFTLDGQDKPQWYDGDIIAAMIVRYEEWFTTMRSPIWEQISKKSK